MMIKTSHSTFVLVAAATLLSSPVTASDDFQRGFNQGQQSAERIWHNNDGGDCSNISNFQRQINHQINNKYSYSSNTYYATKYFDKGAQQGMMTVLHKYQEKCKNDNSHMNVGQCSGLGQDVASAIAEQYASQYCNHQMRSTLARPTLYKEQCRSIGVQDCKGAINESLHHFCGHYVNDYRTVQRLEAQCYNKVSENIYNDGIGSSSPTYRPTPSPVATPTYNPTPSPVASPTPTYSPTPSPSSSNMDVGQCSGLGRDVASAIAEQYASQYCNHHMLSLPRPTLYKEQCRSIGVEDCKGAINESLHHFCGHYVNDYQTVQRLEAQCYNRVSENIYNDGSGNNNSNNRGPGGPGGRGPGMPGQPRINFYRQARNAGAHPPP